MFKKWRLNRSIDRTCLDQIIREQADVRIVDLSEPKVLGPDNDRREYVAQMGLFTSDMLYENIPLLTWYVRRQGSIWSEWQVNAPAGSPLYNTYNQKLDGFRLRDYLIYPCPMSYTSRNYLTDLTHEHWVMHKLTSDTIL